MRWVEPSWVAATPSAPPPLRPGATHLWWTPLPMSPGWDLAARHPQDDEQLSRLPDGPVADRFRRLRGLLRSLLAAYTGKPAHLQDLTFGPHGKPELAGATLHFNLSHADGAALLAFRLDAAIGVDLENARRRADCEGLARRYFHPREQARLAAAADPAVFFALWTAKEAVLKAKGWGVSVPLNAFDTTEGRCLDLDLQPLPVPAPFQACLAAPAGSALADLHFFRLGDESAPAAPSP